jgi:hypothetical protein
MTTEIAGVTGCNLKIQCSGKDNIIIIIIFIYCNWVVTRWQWLFNTNKPNIPNNLDTL